MATVIDSLVLQFGLDATQFTQGQKNAIASLRKLEQESLRSGKAVEAQQKKTLEFFSVLKRELVGFFIGAGVKQFIDQITNMDAVIGRTSRTIGISARELSTWQGAAEQAGGSLGSITGTLGGMRGAMESFLATGQGGGGLFPMLNRFGVSMFDANKQLRDSGEIILDLVDAMKKEGTELPRMAALLRLLPGMNEESINLFIRGREAVNEMREAARQAGGTTKESAEEAERFRQELALLTRTAEGTGRALLHEMMPMMVSAMESLKKLLKQGLFDGKTFWEWIFTSPTEGGGGQIIPGGWFDRVIGERWRRAVRKREGLPEPAPQPYGPQLPPGGVPVKPGAGASSAVTDAIEKAIAGIPGVDRVTARNDAYHQFLGGLHPAGRAIDIAIAPGADPQAVMAAIRANLAQAGIIANVDWHVPGRNRNTTAPHVHIGVPAPTGGIGPVGAPAAANQRQSSIDNSRGDTSNSNAVHIGNMIINAPSGDAEAIAGSIQSRLRTAMSANSGQSG